MAKTLSNWVSLMIQVLQRLPVVLSCAAFTVLLIFPQWTQSTVGKIVPLTLLSVFACIEKLSAVLNTVSVERDWTVVIAGADEARLATMNAQMRRIDLFCKLAGPLAISLIDSASTRAAILATAAMSATSVFIEYLAIARVYHGVPALRESKSPSKQTEQNHGTIAGRLQSNLSVLLSYVRHAAFLPSFALALLYLTVLSFSGQFITYLFTQDLSSATVAALRGLAAVFELSATWLGPWLHARMGPVRAGIWFLNAELIFITLACVALWLPAGTIPSVTTTFILLAAVILSRTGLWGFDLSAQLIIQDEVEPAMRGTFSSLEASFQNTFEMLAFLSTVVFPRPEDFRFPAAISALAVAVAAVLYACFVRDRRGHLLHSSKCFDRHERIKQRQWNYTGVPLQEGNNAEEGHDNIQTSLRA
jgi:iron-regulated transporter 1